MKALASSKVNQRVVEKKEIITAILVLSLVILGISGAILYNMGAFDGFSPGDRKLNMDTNTVVEGVVVFSPDITENPSIAYPGYGSLTMRAGRKTQAVYLHNPKENTCYFQISIILPDGKTLWQSDYLEPGNAFNCIELSEALEKGIYENAVLLYDSYSIKDGRQLNGSSINLTIQVD